MGKYFVKQTFMKMRYHYDIREIPLMRNGMDREIIFVYSIKRLKSLRVNIKCIHCIRSSTYYMNTPNPTKVINFQFAESWRT